MWGFRSKKKQTKGKKQEGISEVTKQNIKDFLAQIDGSIDQMFSGQDSKDLEETFRKESEQWFNNTVALNKNIDSISFKVGVCYALWKSMQKVNEHEKGEDVATYIA